MLAVFVDSLICTTCNSRYFTYAVMLENGRKYEQKIYIKKIIDPGSSCPDSRRLLFSNLSN